MYVCSHYNAICTSSSKLANFTDDVVKCNLYMFFFSKNINFVLEKNEVAKNHSSNLKMVRAQKRIIC